MEEFRSRKAVVSLVQRIAGIASSSPGRNSHVPCTVLAGNSDLLGSLRHLGCGWALMKGFVRKVAGSMRFNFDCIFRGRLVCGRDSALPLRVVVWMRCQVIKSRNQEN